MCKNTELLAGSVNSYPARNTGAPQKMNSYPEDMASCLFLEIVLSFIPDESRAPKLPAPENYLFQDMTPGLCTGTHLALPAKTCHTTMVHSSFRAWRGEGSKSGSCIKEFHHHHPTR